LFDSGHPTDFLNVIKFNALFIDIFLIYHKSKQVSMIDNAAWVHGMCESPSVIMAVLSSEISFLSYYSHSVNPRAAAQSRGTHP
jgi:hypothetical protein